mmetsp:Transcript_56534/g.67747  ORF Transcript_56534/g.67747 Transcript_56534/m.67747 type:complete len:203 (+) Transcript_56534:549-1157(+)
MYTSGLLKNAVGNADATSCHAIDARIVVTSAPSRPVLKNSCIPSETPSTFSPLPGTTLRLVTRAITKKFNVTVIWRPIMKPGRLFPSPRNNSSHVFLANTPVPRSDSRSFATAKKAICIPSSKPTTLMRTKNKITATPFGTPFHIVVWPSKSAPIVTSKQKNKMITETKHLDQKNSIAPPERGGSLDFIFFPAIIATIICIT